MRAVASIPTVLAPRPHPGTAGTRNSSMGTGNGNINTIEGGKSDAPHGSMSTSVNLANDGAGGKPSASKEFKGSTLFCYDSKPKTITGDNIDKVPIDPDRYADKFESVTRMLMRKTEHIVKGTSQIRKSNKQKIKKMMRDEMRQREGRYFEDLDDDNSNCYKDSGFELGDSDEVGRKSISNINTGDTYSKFYDSFKEGLDEKYDNDDDMHGSSKISLPAIKINSNCNNNSKGVTFDENEPTLGGGGSLIIDASSVESRNSSANRSDRSGSGGGSRPFHAGSNVHSPIRTVEFGSYKSPGQKYMEYINSPLPPGWISNRVNESGSRTRENAFETKRIDRTDSPNSGMSKITARSDLKSPSKQELENAKSKLEWENDLARHILSIFATSNAQEIDEEDLTNSNTILEYLDTKRTHNLDTVTEYLGKTTEEIADAALERKSPLKNTGESKDNNDNGSGGNDYSSDEFVGGSNRMSSVRFDDSLVNSTTDGGGNESRTNSRNPYRNLYSKSTKKHPRQSIRVDTRTGLPTVLEELAKEKPNRNPFYMVNTNHRSGAAGFKAESYSLVKTTTLEDIESKAKAVQGNRPKNTDANGNAVVSNNKLHGVELSADMANILTSDDMKKEESYTKSSKFRTCLMVKFKRIHDDGFVEEQMVALRGPPKVSSIWFTATGEVFSDWLPLLSHPMGEKLAAQLKAMYERKLYHQYSSIVFKVLNDVAREKSLGGGANSIREQGRFVENIIKGTYMSRHQDWVETLKKSKTIRKDDTLLKGTLARSGLTHVVDHDTGDVKKVERDLDPDEYGHVDFLLFASTVKFATHLEDSDIVKYWKQFVFTSLAFATLYIEKSMFNDALNMLMKCESWSKREDVLPKQDQYELLALTFDGFAYFFYQRGKYKTAYTMMQRSLKYFDMFDDVEGIGVCLLHVAASQVHLSLFKDAHATLHRFLAMVEVGRLSVKDATPRQLCVIAVAYHNMAVVQLKLLTPDLACKSSNNARKLAKLCLSYSNRWMKEFEWTHKVALEDMKFHLTMKTDMHPHHAKIMKGLVESMVDPAPPV